MATPSTGFVHSIPKLASVSRLKLWLVFHKPITCPPPLVPARFLCNCSLQEPALDFSAYKEKFSKRMAMAGLRPHHRIGQMIISLSRFLSFGFPLICEESSLVFGDFIAYDVES